MMRIRLTNNAAVRFDKGAVLDVSDAEASRLAAFNLAEMVAEEEEEKKPPRKRKAKKAEE